MRTGAGTLPIGAPEPMSARPVWFRALVGASDRLTRLSPPTGMRIAHAAGAACHAAGLHSTAAAEVAAAFPSLAPAAASRLSRALTAQDFCCRAFDRLLHSAGPARAAVLLGPRHVERFAARLEESPAAILLDVHSGPIVATSLALQRLGRPALIVRMSERGTRLPGFEVASLEGDEQRRAQALRRAIDWLKAGRPVVIAADSQTGTLTAPVPCCGRSVRFRRGAFVLSRLSSAPIVPLFFRWGGCGSRIEVDAGPSIRPTASGTALEQEAAMAAEVAAWLDRRLRARPADLSLALLRWLLAAPSGGEERRTQNGEGENLKGKRQKVEEPARTKRDA